MHARKISIKKHIYASICLLLAALVCISSIMSIVGVNAAYTPTNGDTITFKYEVGKFYDSTNSYKELPAQVSFDNKQETATVNSSKCVIIPSDEFTDRGVHYTGGDSARIDAESFWFGYNSDGSPRTGGNVAYSFTGWMIKGSTQKIPGQTVFQPGDTITPDVLGAQAGTTITFEALWGKCYFVRRHYSTMTFDEDSNGNYIWGDTLEGCKGYTYTVPSNATQWSNPTLTSTSPTNSLPSIDTACNLIRVDYQTRKNYDTDVVYDAYATVIMLDSTVYYYKKANETSSLFGYNYTNDDDWQTRFGTRFTSFTFKSHDPNDNHALYYKPAGVQTSCYGNVRFDNVKFVRPWNTKNNTDWSNSDNQFQEKIGTEFKFFYDDTDKNYPHYCEFTARFNKGMTTSQRPAIRALRPNDFETCVVNGGVFSELHIAYGGSDRASTWISRTWRIGRNAYFLGDLIGGSQSLNEHEASHVTGNWNIYMTGGRVNSIYGASSNAYSTVVGDRNIYILGDEGNTTTFSHKFYEQDGANHNGTTVTGNSYIPTIKDILTGGGYYAEMYGDSTVYVNASNVDDIYGGGYQATATVHGNIDIDVIDSTVTGNIYGGGYQANCEKVGTTYNHYTCDYNERITYTYEFEIEGNTKTVTNKASTSGDETKINSGKNYPLRGFAELKTNNANFKNGGSGYGGKVNLNIVGSTVGGGVRGSGSGGTRELRVIDMKYYGATKVDNISGASDPSKLYYVKNTHSWKLSNTLETWANTAPTGFPSYEEGLGVLAYATKSFAWLSQSPVQISAPIHKYYYYLSIATVESVDMTIDSSKVSGTVYGGGDTANVNGNVVINIQNGSVINNSVYGGGAGGTPPKVTLYQPVTSGYTAPTIKVNKWNTADEPTDVTTTSQSPKGNAASQKIDEFTWSNDPALKATGYDINTKTAYSPNVGDYGKVQGSVTLNVTDSQVRGTDTSDTKDLTITTLDGVAYNKNPFNNNGIGENGSVYGGGSAGKVVGNITTTLTNAIVTQTVCGGCAKADVGGNVTTIVKGDTLIHDDIYGGNHTGGNITGAVSVTLTDNVLVGRVYGGGYKSNYTGTPSLTIKGKARVTANGITSAIGVYGGCAYGSDDNSLEGYVGGTNVLITENAVATNVYLGSNGRTNNGVLQGNVHGNTKGVISGNATVSYLYGGGNTGDVTGNVELEITENATLRSEGYGGGNNGDVGGVINFNINTDLLNGPSLYGGGNNGNCNVTNLNINGVTVGNDDDDNHLDQDATDKHTIIFGGCKNADVTGSSNVNVADGSKIFSTIFGGNDNGGTNKKAVTNLNGSAYVSYIVYGGNNAGGTVNETYVNMNDSSLVGDCVYGGNYTGGTSGDTHVIMNGTSKVISNLFGGGREADITGKATVILNDNAVANHDLYGGGHVGDANETYVQLNDNSKVEVWLYAGGLSGNVAGVSELEMNGSSIVDGNVFGGGCDGSVGSTKVTINSGIPSQSDTNYYNLYGGGRNGAVLGNVLMDINGGTFNTEIYGGGRGDMSSADVNGNVVINVNKLDSFDSNDNIYGGCNERGTVKGTVTVNIKDSNNSAINKVYGGGKGTAPTTEGLTSVNINFDGTINNVYGGGANATVADTNVTLTKGTVTNSVYGGGEGQTAVSTGNTQVNINGGVVTKDVYGAGNAGAVSGNSTVNTTGGTVTDTIYGGGYGETAVVSGNTKVEFGGGYAKYVFGAGNAGDVKGNSTVNMTAGDVGTGDAQGRLYGGAKVADIEGNVYLNLGAGNRFGVVGGSLAGNIGTADNAGSGNITMVISGGTHTDHVFGGNNQSGTVYGNVNVTTTGGTFAQFHGGNNGDMRDSSLIADSLKASATGGAVIKKNVTVTLNGGTFRDAINSIYGGSNHYGVIDGDIEVNLNSGNFRGSVFGGGYTAAHNGKATVNVAAGATVGNGDKTDDIVFGAGNGAEAYVGETHVNIYGKVCDNVYGGGRNSHVGKTVVTVFDGASVTDVYGGGWGATQENSNGATDISTTVNIEGGTINSVFGGGQNSTAVVTAGTGVANAVTVNVSGGTANSIHGGGYQAAVNGNVDFNITGGTVNNNTTGGGFRADINGNVDLEISGGTLGDDYNAYTNEAIDVNNPVDAVAGGGLAGKVTGNISVAVKDSATINSYLYGGGLKGNVGGNITTTISGGVINGQVYGGCYGSDVGADGDGNDKGNITLNMTGGTANSLVFGGNNHEGTVYGDVNVNVSGTAAIKDNAYFGNNGNGCGAQFTGGTKYYNSNGDIPGATIKGQVNAVVSGGTFARSVYCANNEKGNIEGDIYAEFADTQVGNNIYGGGFSAPHYGNSYLDIKDTARVVNSVYGGGNAAYVGRTYVTTAGQIGTGFASAAPGCFYSLFGGGAAADVGEAHVEITNGTVYGYVYGGGREGNVGSTDVNITGGTMNNDVNGGGKNGTSRVTDVSIKDTTAKTVILGNVYGGGEGEGATVFEDTNVEVDLVYDFTANEKSVTTDSDSREIGSGESSVTLTPASDDYSYIAGSVYGGGDLGRVGEGSIITGFNRANISTEGSTSVTVKNGNVKGSVFGGGRGIPAVGVEYTLQMGVIFGTTNVDVVGGYVETNVYGGGEQSRVYANTGDSATNVNINSNIVDKNGAVTGQNNIAIGGSVFGGGDRGSGDTVNASVPTTVGDSNVIITGNPEGAPIYFLHGGVYGDGNLCLVSGNRTITINDLVTSADSDYLKTFYSIQRADVVNLNNAEVVLLGAVDLVEEGDDTVYSINRVGYLYMNDGSTVKLDQLVKYLGGLESDVDTDRKFIYYGYNGKNNYDIRLRGQGYTRDVLEPLPLDNSNGAKEVKDYIRTDVDNLEHADGDHGDHNVLCVANGLYVDVMKENDEFGPVKGLFTLQLLYAVPGQGGGFVYGDINTSTGDFICTTLMRNDNGSVISGTEASGLTYVKTKESNPAAWMYMDIIDNVGMYPSSTSKADYDYYYWYINGGSVTYDVDVISYVGTDDTAFSSMSTIPSHAGESYRYAIDTITGNETLKEYIKTGGVYTLTDNADVEGNEIAIEYRIGTTSLGFLTYNEAEDKWYLNGKNGMQGVKEGENLASLITENTVFTGTLPDGMNFVECVLHRSTDISTITEEDMTVDLTLKLFDSEGQPPENRTHIVNVSTDYRIIRVSPSQVVYHESIRNYGGLSMQMPINITKESAFTVEYKTRYIPRTFVQTNALDMAWAINTDNAFPAGTKLSMVDLTGEVPTYYYYICNEAKTEVDLEDFMQMGTEIAIKNLDVKPAFIQNYDDQLSTIITERLLFVVDFNAVTDWAWSLDNTYNGEVTLSHFYDGTDIMDYTDPESSSVITPSEVPYSVHATELGVKLDTFDIEFKADSYPDKSVAQFDVVIEENDVWVDTRYYENEFALKLELVDENGTVRPLPTGITFEANGETFMPHNTNTYAAVAIPTYGKYTVNVDTSAYGIKDALATGDNTVRFKATLYAAPEARYNESIAVNTDDQDSYTIGAAVEHSLYVKTDNTVPTNLVLSSGETFTFNLNTMQSNDSTSMVNVECYSKTDEGYTQRCTLSNIFDGSADILQPTNGTPVTYTGTIAADAPTGMYRLVFTYAERTEYIYIIID